MVTETDGNGSAQSKGMSFDWGALAIVSVLVLLAFSVSVIQRAPWFGELPSSEWRGLEIGRHSAALCTAVNNWLDEGAMAHTFAVRIYPASVENSDYATRGLYVSYPPGHLVPLFLLAKALACHVDAPLLMSYSFGFQFLTAYFLCLTALFFVRKSSASLVPACLLSSTPAVIYLLMPGPMWYYMDLYGPEMSVLLPFILVVYIELRRDSTPKDTHLHAGLGWIQSVVIAWGVLTEWLFIFVVVTLCLKRLTSAQAGRRILARTADCMPLIIPMILGLGLYFVQLVSLGGISLLLMSGNRWAGPGALYFPFLRCIKEVGWDNLIQNGGYLAPPLLWITAIVALIGAAAGGCLALPSSAITVTAALMGVVLYKTRHTRGRRDEIRQLTTIILLLLVPCLFRTAVLLEHERQHGFDGLKYLQVISLSAPVLVPLLLLHVFHDKQVTVRLRKNINTLFVVIFLATVLYVFSFQGWLDALPPRNPDERVVAKFIKENTSFSDIVFSTDVVTPSPADGLCWPHPEVWRLKEFRYYSIEPFCNKRIYPVLSCKDILWHIRRGTGQNKDLAGDYNVVLFERNDGELRNYLDLMPLAALGGNPTRQENMTLYRVSRGVFEGYARSIHVNWDCNWN